MYSAFSRSILTISIIMGNDTASVDFIWRLYRTLWFLTFRFVKWVRLGQKQAQIRQNKLI